MTLEKSLVNLDRDRIIRTVEIVAGQAQNGRTITDMVTPELEQKYDRLFSLIDGAQDKILDSIGQGGLAPETAVAINVGIRIGMVMLMEYAESESIERQFGQGE